MVRDLIEYFLDRSVTETAPNADPYSVLLTGPAANLSSLPYAPQTVALVGYAFASKRLVWRRLANPILPDSPGVQRVTAGPVRETFLDWAHLR